MFRAAVLVAVGIVALVHAGTAMPLDEASSQEEDSWNRAERSAKEGTEAIEEENTNESSENANEGGGEGAEGESHNINKRRNLFKQSSAEENANQLFRNAYKIHSLNPENADSSEAAANEQEEDRSINEMGNREEPGDRQDSANQAAAQDNVYGEEKPMGEAEKATDEGNAGELVSVENNNRVAEDSGKYREGEDVAKMRAYATGESHHSKRCGAHRKEPPPCDEKPHAPCDYEETEKYKQNSTKIAQQAAKAAKLASDSQKMAAEHAARIVKTQLSEQAQQASQKAQAVLAGKESMVAEIECQLHEAEELYKDMRNSLEHIRQNLETAECSRKDACDEVEALQIAVKIARKNIADAEAVVEGTEEVVEEREALLHSAKRRLQTLLNQLKAARCDYRNTKVLAGKAALAAAQARANVSRCRRKLIASDHK